MKILKHKYKKYVIFANASLDCRYIDKCFLFILHIPRNSVTGCSIIIPLFYLTATIYSRPTSPWTLLTTNTSTTYGFQLPKRVGQIFCLIPLPFTPRVLQALCQVHKHTWTKCPRPVQTKTIAYNRKSCSQSAISRDLRRKSCPGLHPDWADSGQVS